MLSLYDVPAPAKLNLFLHVTGRRADGYHLLQSAFMLIDWCDTLHFERSASSHITREDWGAPLDAPLPADDLSVRAARALQTATGCTQGARIGLHKRIPAQAGLGGGSSDAASTLLALNRLWGLHLPHAALAAIGAGLGADVPFFLGEGNAWVEGIGEQLRPLRLPPARFAVLKPPRGVATAEIFGSLGLGRNTIAAIISGFAANPWSFGRNDLQPVAARLCPQIPEGLEWLGSVGLSGRMTGSGSALFAWLADDCKAPVLPPAWAQAGWQLRVCGNLAAHPLAGWAGS
ncbi:MAG: 4-(cytidine 5'-diphospho)-2-C-methyl-D-erythritol kinase [Burkholderiaceae bacterium]|jgi:4-diphosphocytidyl-2-C-methyl-D-erythritol kinase|nr:4-(cytidine 5'-diphospho)-2-C-methyl-D-erythritol kinase [Burkholderiaceae bacterium]